MRIATMTDVHANLPALQAALRDIGGQGCDVIYHTGDAIGIGPYPAECLDLLLTTPRMRCLLGNHDAWFAFGLPDPWPYSPEELVHQRWAHEQLDPVLRAEVANWPAVCEEAPDGVRVAFLHYAPTDAPGTFAPIVATPSPEDLDHTASHQTLVDWDEEGLLTCDVPGSMATHRADVGQ